MNTREKLIRQTPQLLDAFRSMHCHAALILIDREGDPCTTAVLQRLGSTMNEEAQKPASERWAFVGVSVSTLIDGIRCTLSDGVPEFRSRAA